MKVLLDTQPPRPGVDQTLSTARNPKQPRGFLATIKRLAFPIELDVYLLSKVIGGLGLMFL